MSIFTDRIVHEYNTNHNLCWIIVNGYQCDTPIVPIVFLSTSLILCSFYSCACVLKHEHDFAISEITIKKQMKSSGNYRLKWNCSAATHCHNVVLVILTLSFIATKRSLLFIGEYHAFLRIRTLKENCFFGVFSWHSLNAFRTVEENNIGTSEWHNVIMPGRFYNWIIKKKHIKLNV